ncbi:hypothetical protein BHM03_00007599 [Ensete ventricosum]|nr:hypothetical protein BHM03_00007599 [Ensete ventricosum]
MQYWAVRIGPPIDWYVDHPLLGGTVEWGCFRSVNGRFWVSAAEFGWYQPREGEEEEGEEKTGVRRSVARGRFLLPAYMVSVSSLKLGFCLTTLYQCLNDVILVMQDHPFSVMIPGCVLFVSLIICLYDFLF